MDTILNLIAIIIFFSSIFVLKALNPDSSRIKQIVLVSALFSCVSNLMIFLNLGTFAPKVILGLFVFIVGHLSAKTKTALYLGERLYDSVLNVFLSLIYFLTIYILLITIFYIAVLAFKALIKLAWKKVGNKNNIWGHNT